MTHNAEPEVNVTDVKTIEEIRQKLIETNT